MTAQALLDQGCRLGEELALAHPLPTGASQDETLGSGVGVGGESFDELPQAHP